jgi:hypothetical protein
MDATTFTTNTSDTTCSGTFQVSSDNFATCAKMTGLSFTISDSYKTFTLDRSESLNGQLTYKFRVTSGATDLAGNSVSMTAIDIRFN